MNAEKFKLAKEIYDKGDYRAAARAFLESAEPGTPIANGPAYHMAGNCFMRLRRYDDAITVYEHALKDDSYLKLSAVESNLANAYFRSGDFSSAAAHFQAAIDDPEATEKYKAYQGLGAALMEQDKFEEAAVAYRQAAIEPNNPDPGRAILNLGISLMAMDRPFDAEEAYKAVLATPSYKNKGLALANLGMAQFCTGQFVEAVHSFSEAENLFNFELSEPMKAAFVQARLQAEMNPDGVPAPMGSTGASCPAEREGDEAEEDPIEASYGAQDGEDDDGDVDYEFDTKTMATLAADLAGQPTDTFGEVSKAASATSTTTPASAPESTFFDSVSEEAVDDFFARDEKEIKKMHREQLRAERRPFGWLKWVLAVILILAIVGGSTYYALIQGYGYPSGKQVVETMLGDYNTGKSFEKYWQEGANAVRNMAMVPVPSTFEVGEPLADMKHAKIIAVVTPDGGDPATFSFSLERHLISWKIVSVDRIEGGGESVNAPIEDAEMPSEPAD